MISRVSAGAPPQASSGESFPKGLNSSSARREKAVFEATIISLRDERRVNKLQMLSAR